MRWISALIERLRGKRQSAADPRPDAKELSREDMRDLLDAEIRNTTGMTLPQFTAALKDGTIDPESPRIAGLAILVGARAS
jgi:hypothetical protein